MELVAHLRLSKQAWKQAWIDLVFFCGVPSALAVLSAVLGPYVAKSAALSEGRAIVLWIAFVVIFHETLGWERFAPRTAPVSVC